MQPFKYDLPKAGTTKRSGRAAGIAGTLLAALAAVGACMWTWNSMPRGVAAGALGWPQAAVGTLHINPARAHDALREGEKLLRSGRAAEAAKQFDEALRHSPSLTVAHQRGLEARAVGNLPPLPLAQLLTEVPARVTFLLARAQEEAGHRPAAALDDVDSALALAPADPRALRARAANLERAGDNKAAVMAYEQALRVAPDNVPLAAGLIALRFRLGDLEKATSEAHTRLLPLAAQSHDSMVHVGLMSAWLEAGLTPDAMRQQHLAAAPGLGEAERRLYTAQALLRYFQEHPGWHRESGDRAIIAARAVFDPKISATPEQQLEANEIVLDALGVRAGRQSMRGELDAARLSLDEAIALRPKGVEKQPKLAARFADLYVQQAHLAPEGDVANHFMEAAIALVPDHPARLELAHTYANEGISLFGAKKLPQSVKPLERAFALDPTEPSLLARYHEALVQSGVNAALDACAKASGILDRGVLTAMLLEGYERNHEHQAASKVFDAAATLGPNARALAKAELLIGEGNLTLARDVLVKALHDAPTVLRWRRLARLDRDLAASTKGAPRLAALQSAREDYLHALALSGDDRDRGLLLGMFRAQVESALAQSAYPAARLAASQGLALDPHNPALGLGLAAALAQAKETDAAIAACREGIKGMTGPTDALQAPLRERLGSLYRAQKRYAEAIAEYKRGLELSGASTPNQVADLTYGLALAHAANGDREEALNAIRQYVAGSMKDPNQAKRVPEVQALELELTVKRGT